MDAFEGFEQDVLEQTRRQPTTLYRFYDTAGKLLYVGISHRVMVRFKEHRRRAEWFDQAARMEFTTYSCRADAEFAERQAIALERPQYNVAHQEGWSID